MNNIVSPDHFLYNEKGEYVWTSETIQRAWNLSYQKLHDLLKTERFKKIVLLVGLPNSGKSFYLQNQEEQPDIIFWDSTMTTRRARKEIVNISQQYNTAIEVVFLNTGLDVCLERNENRTSDRKIPGEVMSRMYNQLQNNLPQESEGFKKITIVKSS